MKGEGLILLALVALGGFLLYKNSQSPTTKTDGGGVTQPGFGVNFGFTKFGN